MKKLRSHYKIFRRINFYVILKKVKIHCCVKNSVWKIIIAGFIQAQVNIFHAYFWGYEKTYVNFLLENNTIDHVIEYYFRCSAMLTWRPLIWQPRLHVSLSLTLLRCKNIKVDTHLQRLTNKCQTEIFLSLHFTRNFDLNLCLYSMACAHNCAIFWKVK